MHSDEELYTILCDNPLLAEATKMIVESQDGISVSEIARRLDKKQPTVHRALHKLRDLSLLVIQSDGASKMYQIVSEKKDAIKAMLIKIAPRKSYIIGELRFTGSPSVLSSENVQLKGAFLDHTVDVVYDYKWEVDKDQVATSRVAFIILDTLTQEDMLRWGTTLFDLEKAKLDGIVLLVIEGGSNRKSFLLLRRLLRYVYNVHYSILKERTPIPIPPEFRVILIEKKHPEVGIKKARDRGIEILERRASL
ncbi:MAG: ArsR/SmtB family transcription factor [Candidatus Bathyarchaeia archaeon]